MATDKFTEYAEAFYGGDLPASQLHNTREPVMQLVMIFRGDISGKYKDITESEMHRAILHGLSQLHEMGAKHPNIHRSENGMYIEAFKSAVHRVRSIRVQDAAFKENRQREREAAEAMSKSSEHSKIAAALYDLFSKYKQYYAENEFENPAVEAYKYLVQNDLSDFDLGGYAYYVVMMKIPIENEIYWNDQIIDAVNAQPQLGDRVKADKLSPIVLQKGSIGSFLGRLSKI